MPIVLAEVKELEKVVYIKRAISADLSLRNRADAFFDSLEREPSRVMTIDFFRCQIN